MANLTLFISAGEASGDAHGAGVVKHLREKFPDAEMFGFGGDKMQNEGLELLEHCRRMSFMGFAEVIRHLPFIWNLRRKALREIQERKPDLLIFIDYPGFHFSILRKLSKMKLAKKPKVLYYVSPQVWAWKSGRAKELAELADHIAVIFDFEVEIYQKLGAKVSFVGHPLMDEIEEIPPRGQFLKSFGLQPDDKVVGLFPGSRKQEIRRHMPVILETVKLLRKFMPELKFLMAESPTLRTDFYDKLLEDSVGIHRIAAMSQAVLAHANVSLVKSGTTTLEAAYFGNPFVVYYKTSALSYAIGKRVVKIPFIAMCNLIAGEEAVKELVQHDANAERMFGELFKLLQIPEEYIACKNRLKKVREHLGELGAAKRVAEIAIELLT